MNSQLPIDEIKELHKEIEVLQKENYQLRLMLQSKRFKLGNQIAQVYNTALPKGSVQHKAAKFIYQSFQVKRKIINNRIAKKILKLSEKYDKVMIINSIPWDTKMYQRPHHFAHEFAKLDFFVIYLESDNNLSNFRIIQDKIITINSIKLLSKLTQRTNVFFLTPNNIPTPLSDILQIKKYGFQIIYDYLDEFHHDISGDLAEQRKVWDNLSNIKPTLYLATAKCLFKDLQNHTVKDAKIIMSQNAVNINHFNFMQPKIQNLTVPKDIQDLINSGKPIIGFYGALAPWIDFRLLNQIASEQPDWNLLLIGIDYNNSAHKLNQADNIHFIGPRDYKLLPAYSKWFDCAIIPFKTGEIAKATSPVKLFEYMAMGLPTVCTKDLQECQGYDYVYMSNDNHQFINNLAKAIKDKKNNSARRKLLEQAKQNTWQQRAKAIAEQLTA